MRQTAPKNWKLVREGAFQPTASQQEELDALAGAALEVGARDVDPEPRPPSMDEAAIAAGDALEPGADLVDAGASGGAARRPHLRVLPDPVGDTRS